MPISVQTILRSNLPIGFTGSKGDLGYTGSIGYTGSQGVIGYTGSQGVIGYTGSQGDLGYTGSVGFTGSQGNIGFTGSVGFVGSQGSTGFTGSVGFTGSIGFTGSVGYTGSQGTIGYTGSGGGTINAANDIATTTLYPVMVATAGNNETAKVSTTKFSFNASTGTLTATAKSFLIDHPTKPGMRLQYGSLEGPENGVYVRGKLLGSIIVLPDYWIKLIDPSTITVHLTPIGEYQQLYVDSIDYDVVKVKSVDDSPIKCFYTVYAERIDVEKLKVEIL